jgi:hypothetical protein
MNTNVCDAACDDKELGETIDGFTKSLLAFAEQHEKAFHDGQTCVTLRECAALAVMSRLELFPLTLRTVGAIGAFNRSVCGVCPCPKCAAEREGMT